MAAPMLPTSSDKANHPAWVQVPLLAASGHMLFEQPASAESSAPAVDRCLVFHQLLI